MRKQLEALFAQAEIQGVIRVGHQAADSRLVMITAAPPWLFNPPVWIHDLLQQAGLQLSYELVSADWACLEPIQASTYQALQQGHEILYDPEGILSALVYQFGKVAGSLLEPRIEIGLEMARALVTRQFPSWKALRLRPVTPAGWCNAAFRLGEDLLVKLPRAERYELGHLIEHQWLPELKGNDAVRISEHLALGQPQDNYPWHWSVYRWLPGETAVALAAPDKTRLANDLAGFLKQLWSLPGQAGPAFFEQRFFRGAPLYVYQLEVSEALAKLRAGSECSGDIEQAEAIWQQALSSRWQHTPVWVHGDLFPANLLIQNHQLSGVIDFGNLCLGDPACDLAMAWTFFAGESRQAFIKALDVDVPTWARAKGWVLWKALITLADLDDSASEQALKLRQLIQSL